MKFAFLPNYFKKIGLACFFGTFVFLMAVSVVKLFQAIDSISHSGGIISSYRLGYEMGMELASSSYWIIQVGSILLLLSMAFYMLAKEKIDDEYMDAMRWESLRLSVLISIAVTMLFIILRVSLTAKSILFIQFIAYLIAFKVKKSKA